MASLTEKEMGKPEEPKQEVKEDQLTNKDAPTVSKGGSEVQQRLMKYSNLIKLKTKDNKTIYLPSGLSKLQSVQNNKEIGNLYNWYLTEILESKNTDRQDRYREYLFCDANSVIISSALDTYADESTQLGKVSSGVIADSKDPELKGVIVKLLSKLKLNNITYLRDLSRGIAKYGDKPYAVEISDKGVEAIEPVDPVNFWRLEKFIKVDDKGQLAFFDSGSKYYNLINQNFGVNFYDPDDKDATFKLADYKSYLLGFKIFDKIVPPWNCIHFRMFSSETGFHPYGRAIIESVRPAYRHLISAEILMSLIKSTKFDRINYKLTLPGSFDNPFELFTKLNEMRQSFNDHIVGESTRHRVPSSTTDIWTVKTADAGLEAAVLQGAVPGKDEIKDVEYLRDALITGLRLPKDFLLASTAQKIEGDALIQQDLKLARLIYILQSSMLSGIVRLVQIHLVAIGREKDINNFTLSLPFPVPAYNVIELKNQSERLDHVKKFGELLTDTLGVKTVPLKTIRRLLVDMAHMNETLIDNIIKDLKEEGQLGGEGGGGITPTEEPESALSKPETKTIPVGGEVKKENIDKTFDEINKKLLTEVNKKIEKENLEEWTDDSRHYINSAANTLNDEVVLDALGKQKYKYLIEQDEREEEAKIKNEEKKEGDYVEGEKELLTETKEVKKEPLNE